MRAFKIWNKTRTSSFNLSGLNVITTNVSGLGNKFTNDLYDSRIKKHLISQTNSFEQINLTVNFGVHSNAYQKYREFMNFIQANGRSILVIEYYTPGTSRFVDVVLSNASKSQKTGFGVLVETVTFDRLTPYYILQRRTGRSVLVSSRYLENVVPRLELKNNLYPTGTKIRVKSKNDIIPDLTGKTEISPGLYRLYNADGITIDYDIINGNLILDGVKTSDFSYVFTEFFNSGEYSLSYTYVSGSMYGTLNLGNTPGWNLFITNISTSEQYKTYKTATYLTTENFRLYFDFARPTSFSNYTFKIQIEKAGNNLELDRARDEFNGKTLREWFNENLVVNGDLTIPSANPNIPQGFSYSNATNQTLSGGVAKFTATAQNGRLLLNSVSKFNTTDIFYNFARVKSSRTKVGIPFPNGLINSHSGSGNFEFLSGCGIFNNVYTITQVFDYNTSDWAEIEVDYIGAFNASDMQRKGVVNDNGALFSRLTNDEIKAQMDAWINEYQTLLETPTEYSKPITSTQEIELNESILSNQELIIDSENKTVTLNGANAYQITNKDKSTFLNLPEGDYLVECDTPITVEYKGWVID